MSNTKPVAALKPKRCTARHKAEIWSPVAAKHLYWFINEIAIIILLAFAKYDVCRLDGWLFYLFSWGCEPYLQNSQEMRFAPMTALAQDISKTQATGLV